MPGKRLVWIRHRDGSVEVQRRGKSPPPGINRANEPYKPSFWEWAASPNPRKLHQMQNSIAFHQQATKEKEKETGAHASEMPPYFLRKSQGWPDSSSSQTSSTSTNRSKSFKYHFNDPPPSSDASSWSVASTKDSTDLVAFPDLTAADEKRKSRKDKNNLNLDGTNESGDKKKRETNPIAFTPEQDKKLQELKAANKTWKEIAIEMELQPNQISQLKERFKTIGAADASAAPGWDNANSPWEDATTPAAHGGTEKRPKRLKPGNFERHDTDALHALAKQDERARWDRVARRYFDETGRRVVARDIERLLIKR